MDIRIENKDKVGKENCYVKNDKAFCSAWYGLENFELGINENEGILSVYSKEDFLALYEVMTAMKAEIDRLG